MDEKTYSLTRTEIEFLIGVIQSNPIACSEQYTPELEANEKAALRLLNNKLWSNT